MRLPKSLVGSSLNELPLHEAAWKRSEHGGSAWTAAAKSKNLHQPQDGAQEPGTLLSARGRMALNEPEDAGLTGGTRSLMRRTMGLNVTALAGARKTGPRPVASKPHTQVA
jgi:hypothetical protein